jgi:hypothetical protein
MAPTFHPALADGTAVSLDIQARTGEGQLCHVAMCRAAVFSMVLLPMVAVDRKSNRWRDNYLNQPCDGKEWWARTLPLYLLVRSADGAWIVLFGMPVPGGILKNLKATGTRLEATISAIGGVITAIRTGQTKQSGALAAVSLALCSFNPILAREVGKMTCVDVLSPQVPPNELRWC